MQTLLSVCPQHVVQTLLSVCPSACRAATPQCVPLSMSCSHSSVCAPQHVLQPLLSVCPSACHAATQCVPLSMSCRHSCQPFATTIIRPSAELPNQNTRTFISATLKTKRSKNLLSCVLSTTKMLLKQGITLMVYNVLSVFFHIIWNWVVLSGGTYSYPDMKLICSPRFAHKSGLSCESIVMYL